MFTFSSFKKVLFGVTIANGSVVLSCLYVYKRNRPVNDVIDSPSECFRMKTFDCLAQNYDEKTDFIEKVTSINKYKKRNYRKVKGVVLEVGAGSGRNFNFLKNVDTLICVEKSKNMCKELKKKIEETKPSYPVYIINNDITNNLFKPQVFDSVISSFTLCSLEYVNESLQKIHEAMKNNAKFYLVERGIIYNKYLRYILEKLNLYPNQKIPWEYGYYENRDPIYLLKKNNFLITCKLIKNAGSIYVLTAKKHNSHEEVPQVNINEAKKDDGKKTNSSNLFVKKGEQGKNKNIVHINDIMNNPQIPIYYKYESSNS